MSTLESAEIFTERTYSFSIFPAMTSSISQIKIIPLLFTALIAAVVLTYSNHFENGFHFDDSHTVESNFLIRDIKNIPSFFKDARTFSVHPFNQSYRPIVTASLAIDYWLGGSLDPFYFHLTTFMWYLVQLGCMYLLYVGILGRVSAHPRNRLVALFAVAWYGLHPVSAETVNYIIQRGDLYATLAVVAGMVLYISLPRLRWTGLYLVPVMVGALAKPTTIMFAPILGAYILLLDEKTGLGFWERSFRWRGFFRAVLRTVPALVVCAGLYFFQDRMTPHTATPGGASLKLYLMTQPYVTLRYCTALFFPLHLSADTDLGVLTSAIDPRALSGFLFIAALVLIAIYTSRKETLRPIAFGIVWFLLALVPTAVVPLAEVENDHRMFLPFVGLILSVVWSGALALRAMRESGKRMYSTVAGIISAVAVLLLPAYGYGAYQRNEVWRSEGTLWLDVTEKSPGNGRGLMNYGLTLMADGEYEKALDYFERALVLTPNYYSLEINLGICLNGLGRIAEAEPHFQRAIRLSPTLAVPYFYYARWLDQHGRHAEAIQNLQNAIARVPFDFESRYLLMKIYFEQKEWGKLRTAIAETKAIAPTDETAAMYEEKLNAGEALEIAEAERVTKEGPTPERHLQLSFVYYRTARYEQCIMAAQEALKIKPDYAEAYNNIGSAYAALGRWDEAIEALNQALRINPNFQLAKNNLVWAKAQQIRNIGNQ